MKLAQWLKQSGTRRGEFARQIGVTASAVSQLCNDAFQPRLSVLREIEKATDGAVTTRDFVECETGEAVS